MLRWALLTTLVVLLTGLPTAAREPGPPPSEELAPRFAQFLADADLLLLPEEREAFAELEQDYRREAFIRRFWQLRDPFAQTARNELRERWEANLARARQSSETAGGDAFWTLVLHGEPARRMVPRCAQVLRPVELWIYPRSEMVAEAFTVVFERREERAAEWWDPRSGLRDLMLFPPANLDLGQLWALLAQNCPQGGAVVDAFQRASSLSPSAWAEQLPRPSPEWLSVFTDRSTRSLAGDPLPARVSFSYPGRRQSRVVVQATLELPRAQLTAVDLGDREVYRLVVDGEILRRDNLFETFRYRFDLPAGVEGEALPLLVERYLRPGDYEVILRVREPGTERWSRTESEVEVPATAQLARMGRGVGRTPSGPSTVDTDPEDTTVKLEAPLRGLLTGRVRLQATTRGTVERVRFELDGAPVLSKRRPPYSVEVDLGRAPRTHRLRAVALDPEGEVLAEDEILLNAGPHRFTVRLVEPQGGASTRSGEVRAWAEVEVPEGESLDRVEFMLNEDLVATLYQPPFIQPIRLPGVETLSYVRAVAYLANGSAAEDLVFVNAPDVVDSYDVQFVELFTTVVDSRGRTVKDLARDDFEIFENGVPQTIRRFEWVKNVPIHAGVLIDTSASMMEELDDAQDAALRFFEDLLEPRDRAAVLVFNDRPELKVRFTNQVDVLAGGLSGLEAVGETALYDSVIYSLYYFAGLKGKRVLVLLSDGEDVRSRYTFDEVLEFARRSGVAIYTIGLDLPSKATIARMALTRLADETGGRFIQVSRGAHLAKVYEEIGEELRSQYLLAYQSSLDPEAKGEEAFREVEVEVDCSRSRCEAKTIRGYYP